MSEEGCCQLEEVSGKDIRLYSEYDNALVYAVKYNDSGAAERVNFLPFGRGENHLKASFEPDKVFIWSGFRLPYVIWAKKDK